MPEAANEKLYTGTAIDPPGEVAPCEWGYAELDVTTNFSFLCGASHPDELVYTAALLGYRAMAITDVNSLAGVARAYDAARKVKGFKLIPGARLVFCDGTPDVLAWPTDRAAYGRLCRLLTLGRRRAPKGECHLMLDDFIQHGAGMLAAIVPARASVLDSQSIAALREAMTDRLSINVSLLHGDDDASHLEAMRTAGARANIPLVSTNHVHYHDPGRRPLQDVLTCVRHGCTIHDAGYRLFPNAERYLKSPRQMRQLFRQCPEAIERGLEIAARCTFNLSELRYEYPTEAVPPGTSPSLHLRELTYAGAADRYPDGIPDGVRALLEKELKFICGSQYESYFLTVHDLVRFAWSKGILCQGRGSAANSAVCYCLGVTSVDPAKFQLVFERFASSARAEPPDIDIDFEHERREEVIQYVYTKYGRDKAAMTGSLITYRGRSAVRDVGKALGLGLDTIDQLATRLDWWHRGTLADSHLREAGVNPTDPVIRQLIQITSELLGFPRHLSQHVGGMVISRTPIDELVPVENAAMEDRTVIEWDKDDLDTLKFFKVDILALGMLTAISKGLALVNAGRAPDEKPLELHTLPHECPATYEMLCDADSVGVFQVESRAQMSMLPRLQPRKFYDLVVEVAIVRPGPIQGKMVHPYLQRREMLRRDPNYRVEYPKPELEQVLRETLGVPLFQEQAMRVAMVAAGFTPEEADQLRRAMAAWKRGAGLGQFYDKFVNGMISRGYEPNFAERCFQQISGFGEYGFPESHAASFARLVYASSWLKRHHPAAFACALLNSQPMGFYAPAQLVRDAREHGVEVRPVDVNFSDWDCTLECEYSEGGAIPHSDKRTWGAGGPVLRLGLRQIKGIHRDDAHRLILARQANASSAKKNRDGDGFFSVDQFQQLTGLSPAAIRTLAEADAFASLDTSRRHATWDAMALDDLRTPLTDDVGRVSLSDNIRATLTDKALTSGNDDNISVPSTEDVARASLNHANAGATLTDEELLAPLNNIHISASRADPAPRGSSADLLPLMSASREVLTDYATLGLSLKKHPVTFARATLATRWRVRPNIDLHDERRCLHDRWVQVAGLVLCRQRPGTASGVVFITLEDETGIANLIVWSQVYERYRAAARHATLLQADGIVQREGKVVHVLVKRLFDRSDLLNGLDQPSRDFH